MSKENLRKKIEGIRIKLSNRIDILYKHKGEYINEEKPIEAIKCDVKASALYMVLNDIDKALK